MEYQNLSKKHNSLALFYKKVDENIFKENRFVQLMNSILKEDKMLNYAIYTDTFLLKTNLFIPNFHTMYLSNGNHNVVIEDENDLWMLEIFTNNKFYVLDNGEFDYSKYNVKTINHIKEIE